MLKCCDPDNTKCFTFRLKTKTASKYGLSSQPRLVDIIAAVPSHYRKALVPKLKAKPIRTASGVSDCAGELVIEVARQWWGVQAPESVVLCARMKEV